MGPYDCQNSRLKDCPEKLHTMLYARNSTGGSCSQVKASLLGMLAIEDDWLRHGEMTSFGTAGMLNDNRARIWYSISQDSNMNESC